MGDRLIFSLGGQIEFLRMVEKRSGLKVDDLSRLVGIVPRSYRDWRKGKLNMSEKAADIFCERFDLTLAEDKKEMIKKWRERRSEIGTRGGKATFKIHGSPATLEGRRKAGAKTLSLLRERGTIPPIKEFHFSKRRNKELAEFVGIMLGDGGLTLGQATVTLNSEADKEYIFYVSNLIYKLFKFRPINYKRINENAVSLLCDGTKLVEYFVRIGLKIGNKVKQQVGVPGWVTENRQFRIACVRGLMDTDGGIFIHKYKVGGKEYKYLKLCFTNRSIPLLNFVKGVLEELGMTPKIILNRVSEKVWLYNQKEVYEYLKVVGTHNTRLLKNARFLEESDSLVHSGSLLNS